jgi:hypothetical protein
MTHTIAAVGQLLAQLESGGLPPGFAGPHEAIAWLEAAVAGREYRTAEERYEAQALVNRLSRLRHAAKPHPLKAG